MKFGLVGPSYTAISNDIADEECINWYVETIESPGAQTRQSLIRTPGLKTFAAFAGDTVLPPITVPGYTPPPGSYLAVVFPSVTVTSGGTGTAVVSSDTSGTPSAAMRVRGLIPPLSVMDNGTATANWGGTGLPSIPAGSTIVALKVVAIASSEITTCDATFGADGIGFASLNGTTVGDLSLADPEGSLTTFSGAAILAYSGDGAVFDDTLGINIRIAVFFTLPDGYSGPIPPPGTFSPTPMPGPLLGPVRGQRWTGDRLFVAAGDTLFEVFADGTTIKRMDGVLDEFGGPVSIAFSSIELLIVAGGRAYCYELADNTFTDVTAQLVSGPTKVKYSDGYFIVMFANSNKFQISAILDGTTWPGIQVNAVSVFPESIVSIEVSHRELWVIGSQHVQPYQDSGTDEIFDVIPGALIETGGAATFGVDVLDNTVFWLSQDIRGARQAWRANGYTPQRISTHAVEAALSSYSADQISNLVSYSYQDGGHLFWVLYIPGTDCTWVYDVAESLWHKRAEWNPATATYGPHRSWNHTYAFGKHLVGDWQTGNLNEMGLNFLDENGELIRRLRRSPTLVNEMEWIYHTQLVVDFAPGLGPQPPLTDGDGNPRPPQAMLRWSDNRGSTWSNQHIRGCGFAGEYNKRVIWRRLGRSRYRVYELSVSDPIPWSIVDAYLVAS